MTETMRTNHQAGQDGPGAIGSGNEAVRRARALVPDILARAGAAEANRRVPDSTIAQLLASGLFGVVTPRALGGSELGLATLTRVAVEIAGACGSTGWLYGVLAGHSWMLNLFPIEAQHEVFGDPGALTATLFRLRASVEPVAGGYRLRQGEGQFCSGIDHVKWVLVGNSVPQPDGPPEPRFFLVPRSDVEIVDDWFTVGMRATGSKSIRIADAFVPSHRSVRVADMLDGTSPGALHHGSALYRMPFADAVPFSLVGVPLGIARGALQRQGDALGERLADSDAATFAAATPGLITLAEAGAEVDAALALVLEDAERIGRAADPSDLSPRDRARLPRDWAYAAQTARRAVNRVFEEAGGNAIYDGSPLQRAWRDVNAAAQHHAFRWSPAMSAFGSVLAGRPAGGYAVPTRS